MSKAGKFVKKHPWEAAGAAAALGLGGAGLAGAGPLAGLLGAGAAPAIAEAGSAIPGASGLMDLAGATGAAQASTPSVMPPIDFKGGFKNLALANKAMGATGLLSQPQGPPPPMGTSPIPPMAPVATNTMPQASGVGTIDPRDPRLKDPRFLALLQQGGMMT